MKLAITGADGLIGRVVTAHWRGTHDVMAIDGGHDLRRPGDWMSLMAAADTIVHLAADSSDGADFNALRDNLGMILNVVSAAENARRIVYASSIWAMHEQTSLGPRGNYYSAAKISGEAILRAWSDIHRKPAVSLRIGRYGEPLGFEHELLRVDESSLRWWFDKAIAHDEPNHAIWLAAGRTNGVA